MADTKKDEVVDHFDTYEEYLDTFVETEDLRYLGESEIARIIVELGYSLEMFLGKMELMNLLEWISINHYRSPGTLSREKFFQTKAELAAARNINNEQDDGDNKVEEKNQQASVQKLDVLLSTVKERFSANLEESKHSIIFLSVIQENGMEVSGFIDLAQRVKKENFMPYLTGQKQLRPRPGDLSYANLTKKKSKLCSSDNWQVLSEDNQMPAINFVHKSTGTKVSSLWVIGSKKNGISGGQKEENKGWKEVDTGERGIKIMCFDEKL